MQRLIVVESLVLFGSANPTRAGEIASRHGGSPPRAGPATHPVASVNVPTSAFRNVSQSAGMYRLGKNFPELPGSSFLNGEPR